MPELPEVETVRRGLAPFFTGGVIAAVEAKRPDLRFPLPEGFAGSLTGARIEGVCRRGKYLIAPLVGGQSLIMHLGMSGRFLITPPRAGKTRQSPGEFTRAQNCDPRHDHVIFHLGSGATVTYNDPRRFGFMDLALSKELDMSRHFMGMGPEPLGEGFSAEILSEALRDRRSPIKAALLDQSVVAGLGNIYVCEALFRAGISPKRRAGSVSGGRAKKLYPAIVSVLEEAIAAGGSSLRDFAAADGALGYFQHRFDVYGRENHPCHACATPVRRLVQSGRSTFYCGHCQR